MALKDPQEECYCSTGYYALCMLGRALNTVGQEGVVFVSFAGYQEGG